MQTDPSSDDGDLEARFGAEFTALAERTDTIVLQLRPLDAWILLSQLQLALRHPENTGPTARRTRQIAEQLQALVATDGAMAIVARRGWDPQHDEPRTIGEITGNPPDEPDRAFEYPPRDYDP